MKRNQKGEVILATVVVLLASAFIGLVSASKGDGKQASAEKPAQVAEAK